MSDSMIQRIIDRLRAVAAPPPDPSSRHLPDAPPQIDPVTGRRVVVSNMNEVDRMAAGLPPIQR